MTRKQAGFIRVDYTNKEEANFYEQSRVDLTSWETVRAVMESAALSVVKGTERWGGEAVDKNKKGLLCISMSDGKHAIHSELQDINLSDQEELWKRLDIEVLKMFKTVDTWEDALLFEDEQAKRRRVRRDEKLTNRDMGDIASGGVSELEVLQRKFNGDGDVSASGTHPLEWPKPTTLRLSDGEDIEEFLRMISWLATEGFKHNKQIKMFDGTVSGEEDLRNTYWDVTDAIYQDIQVDCPDTYTINLRNPEEIRVFLEIVTELAASKQKAYSVAELWAKSTMFKPLLL